VADSGGGQQWRMRSAKETTTVNEIQIILAGTIMKYSFKTKDGTAQQINSD
jgi:hypothetical protein